MKEPVKAELRKCRLLLAGFYCNANETLPSECLDVNLICLKRLRLEPDGDMLLCFAGEPSPEGPIKENNITTSRSTLTARI